MAERTVRVDINYSGSFFEVDFINALIAVDTTKGIIFRDQPLPFDPKGEAVLIVTPTGALHGAGLTRTHIGASTNGAGCTANFFLRTSEARLKCKVKIPQGTKLTISTPIDSRDVVDSDVPNGVAVDMGI